MTTKLGNLLRNSISAEKKNLNDKAVELDMFTSAIGNDKTNSANVTKTTIKTRTAATPVKEVVKSPVVKAKASIASTDKKPAKKTVKAPITKAQVSAVSSGKKQGKKVVKVPISKAKAFTVNTGRKNFIAAPNAASRSTKLVQLTENLKPSAAYLPIRIQFGVSGLQNCIRMVVEIGRELNHTCLETIKVANDDLNEYAHSLAKVENANDLLKLNMSYMALLKKRRTDSVKNNMKVFSSLLSLFHTDGKISG